MNSRFTVLTVLLAAPLVGACASAAPAPRLEPPAGGAGVADGAASRSFSTRDWASVTASTEWDITKTRNTQVDRWIDFLTGRNRERTRLWLERSGRYGPLIRGTLASRGMPEDLLYLALIESGLSPAATSHASAAGMWQFIAETGRRYGLEINSQVDERRDPLRSTEAALSYLQDLYNRFGSWYLSAAAYNTGENRVGRIMRQRFGTERGKDSHFWTIASQLPRETRDYVPLMLAAAFIAKDPEKYGFYNLEYQAPLAFDYVPVRGSTSLAAVARAARVSVDAVEELNPHLVRGRAPSGRGSWVRVPEGTEPRFTQALPSGNDAREDPRASARIHIVQRGENLTRIARRYGVSVGELQRLNGIRNANLIKVGQRLRIRP
ncbi:MAG: transglycosylase SLT domain-containing protein [Gemmatimonas sp.]|nr:transglycosylase SLT domain-containing protein [Gemmatimonas sp.]